MKALRWHARGDIRLDDVPPPGPAAPGELLLRVLWCGICGTDVEEWRHGPIFLPADRPHPISGASTPLTLGHELTGEVAEIGAGVEGFVVGDRVAVDGLVSCGTCRWCRQGRPVLCTQLGQVGLTSDGGLAPWCLVPAAAAVRMPAGLDPAVGVLAETLAVGVRALRRAALTPGEAVTVVGGGAVGLLAAQAARATGAGPVTVVEPHPGRRELAVRLGIDTVLAPEDADPAMADVVLDCTGAAAAVTRSIERAGPGGRVVLLGLTSAPSTFVSTDVVIGEKQIIGSLSHVLADDFTAAVTLLADGTVNGAAVISHRIPLREVIGGGFRALADNPSAHLKILVDPSGADNDTAQPSGVRR